ncbi:hypothetical protein D6D17_09796, partial [Aureobasidium pullulans]
PDSQPRYKRARTQYDTDPRRIASPRHPEERPQARQAHNQPSPHQEPVASPIEYATSTSPGHAPSDSLLVAQKESPEPDNQVLAKEEDFRQQSRPSRVPVEPRYLIISQALGATASNCTVTHTIDCWREASPFASRLEYPGTRRTT